MNKKAPISQNEIERALMKRQMDKLMAWIEDGANPSEFKIKGKTDILLETIVGDKSVLFDTVIDKGFDVKSGEFLYLRHAARNPNPKYVERLLAIVGLNAKYLERRDEFDGGTALHAATKAAEKGFGTRTALALSLGGCDWKAKDKEGKTPLHYLLRGGESLSDEILKEIADKADFSISDDLGVSCADIVRSFALDSDWASRKDAAAIMEMAKEIA